MRKIQINLKWLNSYKKLEIAKKALTGSQLIAKQISAEKSSLEEKAIEGEAKLRDLQKLLDQANQENTHINKQFADLKISQLAKAQEHDRQVTALKIDIDLALKDVQHAKEEKQAALKQLGTMQTTINEQSKELFVSKNRNTHLKKEVEKKNKQLTTAKQNIEDFKQRMAQLDQEKTNIEANSRESLDTIAKLNNELTKVQLQYQNIQDKFTQLNEKSKRTQQHFLANLQVLEARNRALTVQEKDYDNLIAELRIRINDLNVEKDTLEATLTKQAKDLLNQKRKLRDIRLQKAPNTTPVLAAHTVTSTENLKEVEKSDQTHHINQLKNRIEYLEGLAESMENWHLIQATANKLKSLVGKMHELSNDSEHSPFNQHDNFSSSLEDSIPSQALIYNISHLSEQDKLKYQDALPTEPQPYEIPTPLAMPENESRSHRYTQKTVQTQPEDNTPAPKKTSWLSKVHGRFHHLMGALKTKLQYLYHSVYKHKQSV